MSIPQLSYEQLLGLLVIVLTLLVILLSAASVSAALAARRKMRHGPAVDSAGLHPAVEDALRALDNRLSRLEAQHHQLDKRQTNLQYAQTHAVSGIGLRRFNAFADTGSDLSFSLALLNANGDGVVVTSLYGRDEGRVYAKRVEGGASSIPLSDEEKAALAQAGRAGSD